MSHGYAFVQKDPRIDDAAISMAATSRATASNENRLGAARPADLADPRGSSVRSLLQPLMNRLSAPAALIADDGTIVVTNEAWDRFAERQDRGRLALGGNYSDFVHEQALQGSADHAAIASLLDEVVAGRQSRCHFAFRGDGPLAMRASGINLTSLPFRDDRFILVHRYE
jgi:hypothetical protein